MTSTTIPLTIGSNSFPVWIGSGCGETIASEILKLDADRVFVIADSIPLALHGDATLGPIRSSLPVFTFGQLSGESAKSLANLQRCLEAAIEWGVTRRSVVLAFGGGSIGNLAGMVAAVLFRGIRLVHVPTTLLAAHDSVISLKQAVNSSFGKNLFGIYHVPTFVFIDTDCLRSLSADATRSGVCEVIKNALVVSPGMIPRLQTILTPLCKFSEEDLNWMIAESIAAKAKLLHNDPFEKNAGLCFEYGHTAGHAIEIIDYSLRGPSRISHGEAIGLGMRIAGAVAKRLGHMTDTFVHLHGALLDAVGCQNSLPAQVTAAAVENAVRRDNKRGYANEGADELAMILLKEPAKPVGPLHRPLTLVEFGIFRESVSEFTGPTPGAVGSHGAAGKQAKQDAITVVVVTSGRATLSRAIDSIASQELTNTLSALVVVDAASGSYDELPLPPTSRLKVRTIYVRDGQANAESALTRVARLRNLALCYVDTALVAFLDDDNSWQPHHLPSLIRTMSETGAQAIHSWRHIQLADGTPWVPNVFPWITTGSERERRLFQIYRRSGVFRDDSIIRDTVYLRVDDEEYGMVDMGEWLFFTETLRRFPFDTEYTPDDRANGLGEDIKLLRRLRDARVPVACSNEATLCYRLGGFSNSYDPRNLTRQMNEVDEVNLGTH